MSEKIKCIQLDDLYNEDFVKIFCDRECNRLRSEARKYALTYVYSDDEEDKKTALGYVGAVAEVENIINNFLRSIEYKSSSSIDNCRNKLEKMMAEQEVKQRLCKRCKQEIEE